MTLKVYDKTKSLFSVIDYIIEILLEISNNYLNLINAFTNKGKSNSLNYCQKEVIPKFEKMLIILNYFNMVDKYEKELELIGKNRDISISNKFFDIDVITKKDFEKKNIKIIKNSKIKICNILLNEDKHTFICHGIYNDDKFIKFDELIEIPHYYINYSSKMKNIIQDLKYEILKEPINIYKKLSYIDKEDEEKLLNIINYTKNLNKIIPNIKKHIDYMLLIKLNIKNKENERIFKKIFLILNY